MLRNARVKWIVKEDLPSSRQGILKECRNTSKNAVKERKKGPTKARRKRTVVTKIG